MDWFTTILAAVIGFIIGYYFKVMVRIKEAIKGEEKDTTW